MKKYEFEGIIQKHEGMDAAFVEFPYDTEKEFGQKGMVKVRITAEGHTWRSSLAKMGLDCHWIGLTQAVRKIICKNPGDKIHLIVEKDTEERTVEIPQELKIIFAKEKSAASFFDKLSYTHKKEYAQWISDAKKPETRKRRIEKTIEMLKEKEKMRAKNQL
jgi:hypothetical protein